MPAKKTHPEYHLCCSDGPDLLGEQVTERLSDGWQLYGLPFMAVYPPDPNDSSDKGRAGAIYCQAMTRGIPKLRH